MEPVNTSLPIIRKMEALRMQVKPIDEMTTDEFEMFLNQVQEADLDRLSFPAFMEMLWALRAKRADEVIEISAKLVDGNLRLETVSALPVRGNELIFGNKRIVIKWEGEETERRLGK
jgi:hypothetical protein